MSGKRKKKKKYLNPAPEVKHIVRATNNCLSGWLVHVVLPQGLVLEIESLREFQCGEKQGRMTGVLNRYDKTQIRVDYPEA